LVADVWTGTADAAGITPWAEDTAALSYSTTKGVTSTVLHLLAERGLIDYGAPVAEYWPEFAAGGKKSITIAQVLSHRAGLTDLAPLAATLDEILDHRLMEQRLAAARPGRLRGIPAYHALTYGWLAAGIARSVTGKGMGELYRTEIAEPLRLRGLYLGAPPADARTPLAGPHGSQVPFGIPNAGTVLRRATRMYGPGTGFIRAIYSDGIDRLVTGPEPAILRSEMPGGNGVFTARALASVYNLLAHDNPLLSRARVRTISRVQTLLPDRNLLLPLGWRLGYHSIPVVGAPRAFGHIGLVGSGGWADPDSGLAVGFVHNWLPEIARLPRDQFIMLRVLTPIVRAAAGSADPAVSSLPKAG
jgi:CubicO group peptidase (beta-lactamase class C family)